MTEVWPTIHAEREALAADLGTLESERWDTPSLCEGWSVRDVLAHMTATAKTTPPSFFAEFLRSGFSVSRMQNADIAVERGATAADTLARFRAVTGSSAHPPGPTDTWLGEALVHSEDIRRPLGIRHEYPQEMSVRAADFYKGSNLIIGAKRRIASVRLRATDADWSAGDGPEVAGPIVSLVMAMTGRKPALADLSGDGVQILLSRG
jgi:uncharacterized protein (TIGR03083 family)